MVKYIYLLLHNGMTPIKKKGEGEYKGLFHDTTGTSIVAKTEWRNRE